MLAISRSVAACPNCALGREARALVWTEDFLFNLLLVIVPFLLIGAVSALANRVGQSRDPVTVAPPRERK